MVIFSLKKQSGKKAWKQHFLVKTICCSFERILKMFSNWSKTDFILCLCSAFRLYTKLHSFLCTYSTVCDIGGSHRPQIWKLLWWKQKIGKSADCCNGTRLGLFEHEIKSRTWAGRTIVKCVPMYFEIFRFVISFIAADFSDH